MKGVEMENKLTVTINHVELPIKMYQGERVVTLKEIDAVHERPEGTARKRFNDNKEHFIEGVDYFKVPANECPSNGRSIFNVANETEGPVGIDYSGFIYIAFDPLSKLLKIDRTRHRVSRRLASLNAGRTEKITEYEQFECKDTLEAEKKIHKKLDAYRETGEWFSVPLDEAKRVIGEVVADVDARFDPNKRHRGGVRTNITLITESGYLMLVKSFTDDLAWVVQRQLVNTYFQATPEQKRAASGQSAMDMLRLQSQALFELDDRLSGLEEKVENQMTIDHGQQRNIQKAVSTRVCERMAEVIPAREISKRRGAFFSAVYHDLKDRFDVPSYRDIKPMDYASAVAYVQNWIEPAQLRSK